MNVPTLKHTRQIRLEVLICINGIGSEVHFIQMFTDISQIVLTLWKRQN